MNKQQLAQKIWASANQMRSKIEASEYKDFILGFIFYKYLSDKEIEFLKTNDYDDELLKTVSEEDSETVKWVQDNIGYFIAYKDLFTTWLSMGASFDVSNVRDGLSAFSRLISPSHKRVFEKIFKTLETGLSKLGDSSGTQTKAISALLDLIKDIPMDGRQGYDVLGFIYEYLIGMFAANAGKKAGEFYTPHEVSLLMSEIVANHLHGRSAIKIYDPTSGSGSLLINIGKSVSKYMPDANNIKYYAQELIESTYNLTRMNLVMRGISPDNIVTRNGDTLEEDWPYFDDADPVHTYDPLYVDAVVSNPPYSQTWDPSNKEADPRYARFGLAPKGKADYAFLLHDLFHVKPDGIMTIVLPHGVLFRGGEEGEIRKNLIENNHIDAIIGLPANIFFGTGIPTIIMVLRQHREQDDVLIIDASKGFVKEGKNNKLRASDIKRIADAVAARSDCPKFSRVVSREEIRRNDYNLNIPRYVDSSEAADHWDVYASMFGGIPKAEIDALAEYWQAFPTLRTALFTEDGTPYANIATDQLVSAIKQNADVCAFQRNYRDALASLPAHLKSVLIDNMAELKIAQAESALCNDIFARLARTPLIDKYAAFQLLDDQWNAIAVDLEMIQSEGFEAVKKVDPRLVLKKKGNESQEVQEGWLGHILPFELVQRTLLKDEADALNALESQLAAIPGEYEALLDEFSEEDKEAYRDCFSEELDAFIPKEVAKCLKALKRDHSPEAQSAAQLFARADAIATQEKSLKASVKNASVALEAHTRALIENLSDDQALALLQEKWISPLVAELSSLPDGIIDALVSKLQALQSKYANTFAALEDDIHATTRELATMLDQLDGSPYDLKGLAELKTLLLGD
jgi:type I restriction enzyme M protein